MRRNPRISGVLISGFYFTTTKTDFAPGVTRVSGYPYTHCHTNSISFPLERLLLTTWPLSIKVGPEKVLLYQLFEVHGKSIFVKWNWKSISFGPLILLPKASNWWMTHGPRDVYNRKQHYPLCPYHVTVGDFGCIVFVLSGTVYPLVVPSLGVSDDPPFLPTRR